MWFLILQLFSALIYQCAALELTLEGTWVSRSETVVTGPGFYDPVDELLIEPTLPGVSYSFDNDGNWEQALYLVTPNPSNHSCATASLIWQHGKYNIDKQGRLTLTPYESDGRQLLSDPCNENGKSKSTYMRYKQKEVMHSFIIEEDKYYNKLKLQLYEWDGKKQQPLWLSYRPPQMLPTYVLNPTNKKQQKGLSNWHQKIKRSIENRSRTNAKRQSTALDNIFKISILSAIVGVCIIIRQYKITSQANKKRNVKAVLPSVI